MAPALGKKRKDAPTQNHRGLGNTKRARFNDARMIRAQTSDAAFSNGELNVDKFVKSREYEIRALEDGIMKAKKFLTTRAHQELPKELRRRTASHNAKRVPKRLRGRAKREMVDDNTPTVLSRKRKPSAHQRVRLETAQRLQVLSKKSKVRRQEKKLLKAVSEIQVVPAGIENETQSDPKSIAPKTTKKRKVKIAKLREPPLPPSRFRKRQMQKTWLPTHLWHSKRAKMTTPKEPLWRFALPLTPNIKSYRNAHRASADRGAIAWDKSYMATIGLEGVESSITGLLKALGVGDPHNGRDPWGQAGDKWRLGTRTWEGWIHERDMPDVVIAPVIVLWNSIPSGASSKVRRKAFIRVHPASFLQTWEQVLRLSKVAKPTVTIEDLRFEIGSIEIAGPDASEVLVAVLKPSQGTEYVKSSQASANQVWPKLAMMPPGSLPANAVLAMTVADPRLQHPPRTIPVGRSDQETAGGMGLLADWPIDKTASPALLFDRNARMKACRTLPSQKSINRRKRLAAPGEYPASQPTDVEIPVIMWTRKLGSKGTGTWTVLLPWKCVSAVWNSMVYYPLTTGGVIRFGGVREQRQLAYESSIPWFPADYSATKAGAQWELEESARRKTDWDRKPKSRRVEYSSIDLGGGRKGEIGDGWACDWQKLLRGPDTDGIIDNEHEVAEAASKPVSLPLHQALALQARIFFKPNANAPLPANAITTAKISMIGRGRPRDCARVYRLPTKDLELRRRWLDQQSKTHRSNNRKASIPLKPSSDATPAVRRAWLAAMILTERPEPGAKDYPVVPDEEDLIGFVTTGNYSLVDGKGVGIGSLLLSRIVPGEADWQHGGKRPVLKPEHQLCIVRDAGESHGRLAQWELV